MSWISTYPGIALAPALSLLGLLTVSACSDDVTMADEIGDSDDDPSESGPDTESESDTESDSNTESDTESDSNTETESETESESESNTESESDTGMTCGPATEDVSFALTGADAPPDSCSDFAFTGSVVGPGQAGIINLDSCPCNVLCVVPDPYLLTYEVPDLALAPDMPTCPMIQVRRDPETCEPVSIVIKDLTDASRPVWVASLEATGVLDLGELDVEAIDSIPCPDGDQWGIEFGWADNSVVVAQGESGNLPTDDGDWSLHNFASTDTPEGELFAWVGKRP